MLLKLRLQASLGCQKIRVGWSPAHIDFWLEQMLVQALPEVGPYTIRNIESGYWDVGFDNAQGAT